ncbi:hypothetical protein PoB_001021600 [Plakobranchus ocellatus]|uniref:Uncharacterized protein n=1 Tax=Plakobranchus ocellatus TaxID=259542 RepID=A0AAV3YMS1_9GAST|nr:hypothetical protein PoB_001021600 [Plakobranchus ocellatus]
MVIWKKLHAVPMSESLHNSHMEPVRWVSPEDCFPCKSWLFLHPKTSSSPNTISHDDKTIPPDENDNNNKLVLLANVNISFISNG